MIRHEGREMPKVCPIGPDGLRARSLFGRHICEKASDFVPEVVMPRNIGNNLVDTDGRLKRRLLDSWHLRIPPDRSIRHHISERAEGGEQSTAAGSEEDLNPKASVAGEIGRAHV